MAKQIIVTQNNYGILLETQFIDDAKNPIDLTGYSVTVEFEYLEKCFDVLDATIINAEEGRVGVILEQKHTADIGLYKTQWSVVDDDENVTAQEDIYYFVKKEVGIEGEEKEEIGVNAESIIDKFKDLDETFLNLKESLNKVDSQLDNIVHNFNNDSIYDIPYLVTTFNSHDGYKLDMYISYKENEFSPINGKGILLGDYVRDPAPLFYNGKFYIAFTSNGIAIAESSDLINWTVRRVRDNTTERFMAPEFFVDNGNVYMVLSHTDGSKIGDLYVYKTLFLKANEDLTVWNDVCHMSINNAPSNYIDTSFIKVDNYYHAFLKIENTGVIQHYKCTNLFGAYDLVNTITTKRPCEGITCKKRNGKYCLYLDNYQDGYASVIYSNDLINWYSEETIDVTDGTRTQHFDLIELNKESKEIVNNAIKKYNVENVGNKISNNRYGNRMMKVKDFMTGTIFNPPIFDGTIYTFDDGDENITITEINVPNPQKHYELYFMFTKGSTTNEFTDGITLKNTFASTIQGNGGLRTPLYSDFLIGYQLRNSLVKLIYRGRDYVSKSYWLVENSDKDYIVPPVIYLEDIDSNGVIDTLTPVNNQYYALATDKNITINKINTSKMSKDGKFYIVMKLSSITDKTITIKSGGTGNSFIGKRSNNLVLTEPDYIYSFMKENGNDKCRQLGS